jgi:hypothetical protein
MTSLFAKCSVNPDICLFRRIFRSIFLLTITLTKPAQRCTHLRTVVIESNVVQSTNKQHRPGRGVVEIASEFYRHYLYNPHFLRCVARVGVC